MTLSESREDHLENLLILETRSGGFVRQVDMASRMGFSKASISKAMSSLSAEGYVELIAPGGQADKRRAGSRRQLRAGFHGVEVVIADFERSALERQRAIGLHDRVLLVGHDRSGPVRSRNQKVTNPSCASPSVFSRSWNGSANRCRGRRGSRTKNSRWENGSQAW